MPVIGNKYIPFPKVDTDDLYEKVKALLEPEITFLTHSTSEVESTPPCKDVDEFYARLNAAMTKPNRRPRLSLRLVNGSRWKLVTVYR